VIEPRNVSSREPTLLKGRKAASRRRNGLALVIPPGSESRTRSRGFPRNLGGPVASAINPGGRYRVTNSRPSAGAPVGPGSEIRVRSWYRQAKATKRGGTGGGESERPIVCAGQRFDPGGSSPSAARMRGGVSKSGGNASLAGERDHGEPYTGTKSETTDTAKGMYLQLGSVRKDNQRAGCPPRGGIRKACGEVPGRNRGGPPP